MAMGKLESLTALDAGYQSPNVRTVEFDRVVGLPEYYIYLGLSADNAQQAQPEQRFEMIHDEIPPLVGSELGSASTQVTGLKNPGEGARSQVGGGLSASAASCTVAPRCKSSDYEFVSCRLSRSRGGFGFTFVWRREDALEERG